jgi:hypothetical protein
MMDVFRFYLMLVQVAFCSNLIFRSRCENYQLMRDGADVQLVLSIVFALEHGLLRTCSDSLQHLSCALRVRRVAPNLSTPRRRKSIAEQFNIHFFGAAKTELHTLCVDSGSWWSGGIPDWS